MTAPHQTGHAQFTAAIPAAYDRYLGPVIFEPYARDIAQRVKRTRDETFQEKASDGKTLMSTTQIFSLGGATIDNEWNYSHSKLMRGLGIVAVENQARI